MDGRVIEQGGIAQTAGAGAPGGQAETAHEGFLDDGTGEHDIGAFGGEAGELSAVGEGEGPEAVGPGGQGGEIEANGLDGVAVEGWKAGGEAGEDGGGAADGDVEGGWILVEPGLQGRLDVAGDEGGEFLSERGEGGEGRGILGGPAGGGADSPEGEALREQATAGLAEGEFGGAAPEVADQEAMAVEFGIGADAAVAEVGFLIAGEDFHRELEGGMEGVDEIGAIRGFADGGGGDDADGGRLMGTGEVDQSVGGEGGALDGFREEATMFEEALAEAGLFAQFGDGEHGAVVDVGDEEFEGIGADVEDGTAGGGGRHGGVICLGGRRWRRGRGRRRRRYRHDPRVWRR